MTAPADPDTAHRSKVEWQQSYIQLREATVLSCPFYVVTPYRFTIEQTAGAPRETMAYSSVTNATDDLEGLRAGGITVSAIHRDGQTIDEATLRAEEAASMICIE